MNHAEDAKRHRYMAEEMRARGELLADEGIRAQYFRIADSYDELADNEEQLVANLKNSRAAR